MFTTLHNNYFFNEVDTIIEQFITIEVLNFITFSFSSTININSFYKVFHTEKETFIVEEWIIVLCKKSGQSCTFIDQKIVGSGKSDWSILNHDKNNEFIVFRAILFQSLQPLPSPLTRQTK